MFDSLTTMPINRLLGYCGEYSKYYPVDHHFASYMTEKIEQIVERLVVVFSGTKAIFRVEQQEMSYLIITMLRTFYSSSQKARVYF